jgi:hypothetical protein
MAIIRAVTRTFTIGYSLWNSRTHLIRFNKKNKLPSQVYLQFVCFSLSTFINTQNKLVYMNVHFFLIILVFCSSAYFSFFFLLFQCIINWIFLNNQTKIWILYAETKSN